jgi:PIN domain nuclease of toxin-antitoxin system
VKLLLDSHAYLWWLIDDPRLPQGARRGIAAPRAAVHVSPATVWELSIKAALGRLDLDGADLAAEIAANRFVELPITAQHAQAAGRLPRHHDDPFDRLLVAQAKLEGLTVVTRDGAFESYGVPLLWS